MSIRTAIGAAAVTLAAALAAVPPATAAQVKLDAELGQAAVVAGKGKRIYLRIGLEGLALAGEGRRTPVNVGLVIDRSGSMQDDDKIGKAREAAIMALGRLGESDIASVVAFNHEVDVLLPAAHVSSHTRISRAIEALEAGGNTALYAGTEEGIRQVSKLLERGQVNRVILISDGLANVGPSSPVEVAELGRKAAERGITITTLGLGLGYNEDLMTKLAYASDGNHAFVERSEDLVGIFNKEFGDVLSVVAQEIIIRIECRPGFKPLRMLGREASIEGGTVTLKLSQIYGKQQKYAVLEVEVPEGAAAGPQDVADVEISYLGLPDQKRLEERTKVGIEITLDRSREEASLDKTVMGDVTTQLATEVQEQAVELRDAGRIDDAKKLLNEYAASLDVQASSLGIAAAAPMASQMREDADKLDDEAGWNRNRKAMRATQHKNKVQQSY